MKRGAAAAKINLALVVGPRRDGGKHELLTVYQRIALADRVEVRAAEETVVTGYEGDTLVTRALEELAARTGMYFAARITKRIPIAAGLGGGSADAAAALQLGNALVQDPVTAEQLEGIAVRLGADVPFLLRDGPHLGRGDGTVLSPLELPQDYWILLVLPDDTRKASTAEVYARFDARDGGAGFGERRLALLAALEGVRRARDLCALPPNDLTGSPVADELRRLGAFRADVTGAGPAVYGLFLHKAAAEQAERAVRGRGRSWITAPAWYV
jgi:4-diphosphocytidyl-2-C-methyl-D-erythritol kinase